MSVKINTLEIENVKRIRAIQLDCTGQALTVIGGRNGQGKTSVLDAITYALGGERYRPSEIARSGSVAEPVIKITLSNGLVVERSGKNSSLKVTDPQDGKGGQQLLSAFVHQFAIDLPKFLNATSKEKANTLLQIIGVGEELLRLEKREKQLYDERHAVGQIADRKKKFADEMPHCPDAPEQIVTASELIQRQQSILAKNGENQRIRANVDRIEREAREQTILCMELRQKLKQAENLQEELNRQLETGRKTVQQLEDESTAEIEQSLREIDEINAKVRANLDKAKAIEDAAAHAEEYTELSEELEKVRNAKSALLDNADLPLPGLSVSDGELVFRGQKWDCISGAEQLRVSTAIVRRLQPECGFVLLDKLEQMDIDSLREFGQWLESEGLQAIATRVSTGDECSIVIEDGQEANKTTQKYVPGSF